MALTVCAAPGCGALIPTGTRGRHCPTHASAHNIARGSSTARGYGTAHRARRATIATALTAGAVIRCVRCGSPIAAGQPWHLDHDDNDRSRYLGASHAHCNTSAAGHNAHRND